MSDKSNNKEIQLIKVETVKQLRVFFASHVAKWGTYCMIVYIELFARM